MTAGARLLPRGRAFHNRQSPPHGATRARAAACPRLRALDGAPRRASRPVHDEAPPRFSQLVGFLFMVVALLGLGFGILWVAQIAIGFALAAALLNAVFNYCLGCEMYLLAARIRART